MEAKFSNGAIELSKNSIFLAGPTARIGGFKKSWRKEACGVLEGLGFNGLVYIPEYGDNTEFNDNKDFEKQARWEWECLDVAGCVVFWVPRKKIELPGMTTNVEFGRYITLKPKQVVLGYPKWADNMKYMDLLYKEATSRNPKDTLEDTLKEAVGLVRKY